MAVVIPIVASFAAASAATTAVGMFLTYSAVALTTVGALSGNKDLTKIGSILSLAGGAWGAVASSGTSAAATATDAAASSGDYVNAMDAASDAATAANTAGTATEAGSAFASTAAGEATGAGAEALNPYDFGSGAENMVGEAAQSFPVRDGMIQSQGLAEAPTQLAGGSAQASDGMLKAFDANGSWDVPGGADPGAANGSWDVPGGSAQSDTGMLSDFKANTTGMQRLDSSLASQGAQPSGPGMLTNMEKWIQQHKGLTDIALKGLAAATDPRAKYLERQQDLLNRRMTNLNSPIRLGIVRG